MKAILFFLLLFASTLSLASKAVQSLDLLKQKIEQYLLTTLSSQEGSNIQVQVEQIDDRLRLKACAESSLQVFNPFPTSTSRASTIGVRCSAQDNHWTVYVPVKIRIQKSVIIAKRPLPKGVKISSEDIEIQEIDSNLLKQGYFTRSEEVIDHLTKTSIAQGSAINPTYLKTESLIHKGEQVSIEAVNEVIHVSMSGIALNDGSEGDVIQVKNLSSKKIIEATVSGKQQVRVTL
ncbi:flagellar basal body P-ring formation chaperone FlgA [Legionella jordanis]|uniref:Flagella basal body P-ring formation protein FlgA n=1 Tax=Legionella jordanis TaxID=456 RepID=A0A0W0V9Z7_9GAMM|nr:flagellar basal body P-ring formation chaperone FlgA [Legionella jordanis]KTD16981.1 flagellar basal body P-ring biosynthesis protein FlgA [Legionella jordanis]RMX03122.1 flagella basal body P-ring formation protein FlgA [Legionella jordanis]VEH12825.1 flagella basal body P-ring formation protein FlgA [Legionella jordanis]